MAEKAAADKLQRQQTLSYQCRIRWLCFQHTLVNVLGCLLGLSHVLPVAIVLLIIMVSAVLACWRMERAWRPVRQLAHRLEGQGMALPPHPMIDADLIAIEGRFLKLERRIKAFVEREQRFTRDASHELRSPLTVMKMAVYTLAEEAALSAPGQRSLTHIQRALGELETLVEVMLVLAREPGPEVESAVFVVNDVLRHELEMFRHEWVGPPITLTLEESGQFSLRVPEVAFSALCRRLLRNAAEQAVPPEVGRALTIRLIVMPGRLIVATPDTFQPFAADAAVNRHGFELALAGQICERYQWTLEWDYSEMWGYYVRVQFT